MARIVVFVALCRAAIFLGLEEDVPTPVAVHVTQLSDAHLVAEEGRMLLLDSDLMVNGYLGSCGRFLVSEGWMEVDIYGLWEAFLGCQVWIYIHHLGLNRRLENLVGVIFVSELRFTLSRDSIVLQLRACSERHEEKPGNFGQMYCKNFKSIYHRRVLTHKMCLHGESLEESPCRSRGGEVEA